MSPRNSSGSVDDLEKLPSVPRVARSRVTPKPVVRPRKRARSVAVSGDEESDADDDEVERVVPRKVLKGKRKIVRKVISEDSEDESDGDDGVGMAPDFDVGMSEGSVGSGGESEDEDGSSGSAGKVGRKDSARKGTLSGSVSDDIGAGEEGDDEEDDDDEEVDEAADGQRRLLAQLEEDVDEEDADEEDVFDDSDSSEDKEQMPGSSTGRLTMRQRAMKGEKVALAKLESPRAARKATPPSEEWTKDEEQDLKKQQKARLRQMVHDKRNKEKRAATVDKVLRGVTSKRKKLTMASEAMAARIGSRLSRNDVREGCIRYTSNRSGFSISLPKDIEAPAVLGAGSVKAVYPPVCLRDPRTGKRILS